MSLENFRSSVTQGFITRFSPKQPDVYLTFENIKMDLPSGPWVHFEIIPNFRQRISLGNSPAYRYYGILNIMCAVKEDTGTKTVLEIADTVNECVSDQSYPVQGGTYARFFNTEYRHRGVINGYHTINLQIEYKHDICN